MEAITKQTSEGDSSAEKGAQETRPYSSEAGESQPPLPQQGDGFTEDQMRERFGPLTYGGIRTSATSTDIILVRNVHSDYGDVELGRHIQFDGTYWKERPDQMVGSNLKLAQSRKNGNRVLYFTKELGRLRFDGLVKCVAHRIKNDSSRPGALVFDLEMVGNGRQSPRAGRYSNPPSPRASSVPDLDMILTVERKILERRRFASRSELLATLHAGIDSAMLDRILVYLEGSAKISITDGSIRWTSTTNSPHESSNTCGGDGGTMTAVGTAGESAGILSMAERLSADLDNDLPYSAEIERLIADCEAGRPIGKTYTAEEYLRHFDQEYGNDDVESPAK